jgi:predicted flap endonuclease-1-like 5' DNA nuclease
MSELFMEILVYLLIAGLIGFVVGWYVRGEYDKTPLEQKEEEPTEEVVEEVAEVIESEIEKEEEIKLLGEARSEGKDKLSTIKGIGPVLEDKLNKLGIYHFDQIAAWTVEQQAWIGKELQFPKRVEREEWVNQAKELLEK